MTKTSLSQFYAELKRRKVIRVAIVYVVIAWLIVEVASVMFPGLLLPDWSVRLVIGLAMLGFPIALVMAWAIELTPDGAKAEVAPGAEKAQAGPVPVPAKVGFDSIAVLAFLNLSNDPENEYFSEGMSEEVLNLLCKLPQLTVASRTSSFSFKGKDVDLGTVARQLDVDVILEGSVRRSGDRVRITAQLIDGHADRHLWSETYDRELKDVFAVQDEIAKNIVAALELSLSPAQEKSLQTRGATIDMDAYDFYLRGRHYAERGEFKQALVMFEKAIELDPDYALAWAEAEAAAAIALNPQLFEAHYYLGRACFSQGKFDAAIESFKRARKIRPDDVSATTLLTTSYMSANRQEEGRESVREGIKVVERHLSLHPDDALAMSRAANDHIYVGNRKKA